MNDIEEATKHLRTAHNISLSLNAASLDKASGQQKANAELNSCVFLVSAELRKLGTVIKSNSEVMRYFGYSPEEVIGTPIEKFMPRVFADRHPAFMKRVFSTTDMSAIEKVRPIFALDKLGFAIAVRLIVRVVPRLSEGLRLVGTFTPPDKELEQAPVLIIDARDGNLEAVTYNSYVRYGIHPCLCSDSHRRKSFPVLKLFPNIHSLEALFEAATRRAEVILDTTKLQTQEFTPSHHIKDPRLPERLTECYSSHKVKLSIFSRSTYGMHNFEVAYLLVNPLNIGPTTKAEMNFFLDMAAQFRSIRPVKSLPRKKVETQDVDKAEAMSKRSKSSVQKLQKGVKALGLLGKNGLARLKKQLDGAPPVDDRAIQRQQTEIEPENPEENEDQSNWEKEKTKREQATGQNKRINAVFIIYLLNFVFTCGAYLTIYRLQAHRDSLFETRLSIQASMSELQYYLTRSLVSSQSLYIAKFMPAALQNQVLTSTIPPLETASYNQQQAAINLQSFWQDTENLKNQILKGRQALEDATLGLANDAGGTLLLPRNYNGMLLGQKYQLQLGLDDLQYTVVNYLENLQSICMVNAALTNIDSQSLVQELIYFLQSNAFTNFREEYEESRLQLALTMFDWISQVTWINSVLLFGVFGFVLLIEGLSLCFFLPLFKAISQSVVPFGLLQSEDFKLLLERAEEYQDEYIEQPLQECVSQAISESSFHTDSSEASSLQREELPVEEVQKAVPNTSTAIKNLFSAFNPQKSFQTRSSTSLRSIELKADPSTQRIQRQRSKSFHEISSADLEVLSPSLSKLKPTPAIVVSPPKASDQLLQAPETLTSLKVNPSTPKPFDVRSRGSKTKKAVKISADFVEVKLLNDKSNPKEEKPAAEGGRRKFKFTTIRQGDFHLINQEKFNPTKKLLTSKPTLGLEAPAASPLKSPSKLIKRITKKTTILALHTERNDEVAVARDRLTDRRQMKGLLWSHLASVVVVLFFLFPCTGVSLYRETRSSQVVDHVADFQSLVFRELNHMGYVEAAVQRMLLLSSDFVRLVYDDTAEVLRLLDRETQLIVDTGTAINAFGVDQLSLPADIKAVLQLYLDAERSPVCSSSIFDRFVHVGLDTSDLSFACQESILQDKGLAWLVTQVQLIGSSVKQRYLSNVPITENDKRLFWLANNSERRNLRSLIRIYSKFVFSYFLYISYYLQQYYRDSQATNLLIFLLSSFTSSIAFVYGGIWYLSKLRRISRNSKEILALIPSDLIQCNLLLQQELKSCYRTL